MNRKILTSSLIMIAILAIFFMERFDLKEAGVMIYILGIYEIFYLLHIMYLSVRKKAFNILAITSMYLTLSVIAISWVEPFLMSLTHQSYSVEESKRINAYICSYRISKKKILFGNDSVVMEGAFLERKHFWNSYNQNYFVFEPTFDCRILFIDDGGHNMFLEKKVYCNKQMHDFYNFKVSPKDTLAIVFGKYIDKIIDNSRDKYIADTVYFYPYKER